MKNLTRLRTFAIIFIGGVFGTLLRYELSLLPSQPSHFPLGIFVANIIGTFILGIVIFYIDEFEPPSPIAWRLLLGTGFCGGLTTFSTLCAGVVSETVHLGAFYATQYLLLSTSGGLVAFALAMVLIRILGFSIRKLSDYGI